MASAVMMDVVLGRFHRMMAGMGAMAAGRMGMMGRGLVIFVFVMLGSFAVMARGLFVMVGSAVVMFRGRMFVRHIRLSLACGDAQHTPA